MKAHYEPTRFTTVVGQEKEIYLKKLDNSLRILEKNISKGKSREQMESLDAFGEREKWDWNRLPAFDYTHKNLASMIERIRKEYVWLQWHIDENDSLNNRGFIEELDISTTTGMPSGFAFIKLDNLKQEADERLEKIPSYEYIYELLRQTLTTDLVSLEEMPEEIKGIHAKAMHRNFFEVLKESELIGYTTSGKYKLPPKVRKIIPLGGESLWNIESIVFNLGSGLFNIFMLDIWQDIIDPEITEDESGRITLSDRLKHKLEFLQDNTANYLISSIDDEFESLHPVHAVNMLIGPFENKYFKSAKEFKVLPITPELLKEDPEATLLRASIKYAYSPNHYETSNQKIRQIIYNQDWTDEIIVCPAQYSSRVSRSVLGTDVRILEMRN